MSDNKNYEEIEALENTPESEFTDMDFEALDELEKLHDVEKNKDVHFFDKESGFNRFMNKFGTFILANLLFILCCLPVVTIGASLTALNATMFQLNKHDDIKVISIFFKAFKENLIDATIGFIISVAVFSMGLVGIVNGFHASQGYISLFFYILFFGFIMFAALCFFTFYFALLAYYENDIVSQMKNALIIGMAYVRWSFIIWLIWIISIGIFIIEPILFYFLGFVWVMFGFAFLVYQTVKIYKLVFRLIKSHEITDEYNR